LSPETQRPGKYNIAIYTTFLEVGFKPEYFLRIVRSLRCWEVEELYKHQISGCRKWLSPYIPTHLVNVFGAVRLGVHAFHPE
jgi:hypothetical protein